MSEHYFTETPSSGHNVRTIECVIGTRPLRFESDDGVFSKASVDEGTDLLIHTVLADWQGQAGQRALDIGSGYGVLAIALAVCLGLSVDATDVNRRAIRLCRDNARLNNVADAVHVYETDSPRTLATRYDLVVTNPPVRIGKATLYRLLEDAHAVLKPGGTGYFVMRRNQGVESAMAHLTPIVSSLAIVARRRGYWVVRWRSAEVVHD